MSQWSVFCGAFHYEFRMQVQRRAMWATLIIMMLMMIGIMGLAPGGIPSYIENINGVTTQWAIGFWAALMNMILPIGAGILMADRLVRDRKTRMDEMFTSMPASLLARLFGKYLGSVLATTLPILLFFAIGVAIILAKKQDGNALLYGLEALGTIILPALLYIGAYSIACPAVMWVPLYSFLFIGYWGWNNFISPDSGIPTLSKTLLSPAGGSAAKGLFNVEYLFYPPNTTAVTAFASISLLLGLALLAILALWGLLKWRQTHQ